MFHQLNNPTNADIAQFVQQRALDVESWGIEQPSLTDQQAAERAARDYVDMLARAGAPAAGTAAGLLAVGCAHPVPLDPESFAPTAKPFTTFAAIAEHYDTRPHDGCGVMAGPQPGGNVLVALKTTPEAWDEWLRAHALEVREVRDDDDPGRTVVLRWARPLGSPVVIRWVPPPLPRLRSATATGAGAIREMTDTMMRPRSVPAEVPWQLGWAWAVPAAEVTRFRGRKLGPGVELVTDAVVPWYVVRADGWRLDAARPPLPYLTGETNFPAWLLEKFGGVRAA